MVTTTTSTAEAEAPSPARGFGTNLHVEREADLEWYWCAGQSLFEASTFGAVLERQKAFGLRTCELCEGTGFTQDDGTCQGCRGMGGVPVPSFETVKRGRMVLATEPCHNCARLSTELRLQRKQAKNRKRPQREFRAKAWLRFAQGGELAPRVQRPEACCIRCRDAGYIERRPVGAGAREREESSYTPDDTALARYAQVSRWLLSVNVADTAVLQAYYGLSGYRWGGTKWGRLFAVVPLTRSGKRLLGRQANPQAIGQHQLLENLVGGVDKLDDIGARMALKQRLDECTREAFEKKLNAVRSWNESVGADRGRTWRSKLLRGAVY